jgi:thiol:disulfide interchange protein DsbD
MLGVTLALFGTRRAAPPAQVFGLALVYVLGMATMYSTLGVVAALTGKLFGSFMQNPVVLIGIGVLLAAMALSMFGVYEIQMPAALRERAAAVKTTNLLGIFLTGLFVGIFAAPCIAAPIVGVLTVVASRADPLYGFQTFFTLAMGLGAPYLVLGVFSNLLQKLPRSGEWMEWVKKVFGVVMIALALRFVSLGVAPNLTPWIVPVALVVGGTWLGFINRQAERVPAFKAFKRIGGAAAVIGGLAMVAMSPRNSLPMETFSPAALDAARSRGQVVMVDFSADWCVPCHELERYTLSDWRVIERAKTFAAFKADLTHDSPETQAWTERFAITGVPTVLFITPDGREVPGTRVQGFMPAKDFLERMTVAAQAGQRAAEVR